VNFALDDIPSLPDARKKVDTSRLHQHRPSMDYLERAFDDAKYGWYRSARTSTWRSSRRSTRTWRPRQARPVVLHPVHAVPAARERLGHREGEPRRHRPADARVVLPGLRQARAPARGAHAARHRADGRACARATSSPASSSPRRCSSSGRRPAGRSTAPRSTATTSAAPARTRVAALMGAPGRARRPVRIPQDRAKVGARGQWPEADRGRRTSRHALQDSSSTCSG
jgi:hypothetical protein